MRGVPVVATGGHGSVTRLTLRPSPDPAQGPGTGTGPSSPVMRSRPP